MTGATLSQVTGAAFARYHRNGAEQPLFSRLLRQAQGIWQSSAVFSRGFKRFEAGDQAVEHGFIARDGLAAAGNALHGGR